EAIALEDVGYVQGERSLFLHNIACDGNVQVRGPKAFSLWPLLGGVVVSLKLQVGIFSKCETCIQSAKPGIGIALESFLNVGAIDFGTEEIYVEIYFPPGEGLKRRNNFGAEVVFADKVVGLGVCVPVFVHLPDALDVVVSV